MFFTLLSLDMCKINFFISVRFSKNLDSVLYEFGSVRFEKRSSVQTLELFTAHFLFATVNDNFDITDVTHNNDNK